MNFLSHSEDFQAMIFLIILSLACFRFNYISGWGNTFDEINHHFQNIQYKANNFLTGSIPPEVGRLGLDHNLKKIYLGSMPLTFMDELRDIVYAECVVSGCTPLANGNQAEICKDLREVFDEYKQMTFDDCETLRRDCFIC